MLMQPSTGSTLFLRHVLLPHEDPLIAELTLSLRHPPSHGWTQKSNMIPPYTACWQHTLPGLCSGSPAACRRSPHTSPPVPLRTASALRGI